MPCPLRSCTRHADPAAVALPAAQLYTGQAISSLEKALGMLAELKGEDEEEEAVRLGGGRRTTYFSMAL